jgi:hypothetical protein
MLDWPAASAIMTTIAAATVIALKLNGGRMASRLAVVESKQGSFEAWLKKVEEKLDKVIGGGP